MGSLDTAIASATVQDRVDKKVLILFAHPSQRRSEVNVEMFQAAKKVAGVTCVDLYADYPRHNININIEQQRLLDHDVVVFQFPLYWYSTPSIMKEWQDLVLEYGFAYGTDGTALHGKTFLTALTAGGREAAYQTDGYNHYSIRELLHPIEQTVNLIGMDYLPPYALFGSRSAVEEGRIEQHVNGYVELLQALVSDKVDIKQASVLPQISGNLSSVIVGERA
ncbi:NAD(P)H-dependent oxidoreductase [Vibrio gallicus]|uniref:NAD(P)H-dependent oxidoreductase n=1 Tax=Vibrio gallicus TaxID=190897 RepID=UPI0021C42C14|nr:NAD(P)H-dependent oxidoreductase [Vibrio gallicus]